MTPADSNRAQPAAQDKAMALDRLVRIGRAARLMPAMSPDNGRKTELIAADQEMSDVAR
jgi:hypothetical protein